MPQIKKIAKAQQRKNREGKGMNKQVNALVDIPGWATWLAVPILSCVIFAGALVAAMQLVFATASLHNSFIPTTMAGVFAGLLAVFVPYKVFGSARPTLLGGLAVIVGIIIADGAVFRDMTVRYIYALIAITIVAHFFYQKTNRYVGGGLIPKSWKGFEPGQENLEAPQVSHFHGTVVSVNSGQSIESQKHTELKSAYKKSSSDSSSFIELPTSSQEAGGDEKQVVEVMFEDGQHTQHSFYGYGLDLMAGHEIKFITINGELERVINVTTGQSYRQFGEFLIDRDCFEPSENFKEMMGVAAIMSIPVLNVLMVLKMSASNFSMKYSGKRSYLGSSFTRMLLAMLIVAGLISVIATPYVSHGLLGLVGLDGTIVDLSLFGYVKLALINMAAWFAIMTNVAINVGKRIKVMEGKLRGQLN